MTNQRRFATAASALLLSGVGGAVAIAGQGAQSPAAARCAAVTAIPKAQFPNPTTSIVTATHRAASDAQPGRGRGGPVPALPEHCEVVGQINDRMGITKQRFAINFRLRLPADWNGSFFFEGGGGTDGNIGNAFGSLQGAQPGNALALGYAVVSQDAGHDNATNDEPERGGTQSFGFDPDARRDFGYRSFDEVTRAAKAIIAKHYGRAPARSYFAGCSEGGREGLMLAQRFPSHFDGILACAPGMHLPQAALAALADSQIFARVARETGVTDAVGLPLVNKAYSDEDLLLVSNAVLAACDRLDDVDDGLVQNFTRCTSALVVPQLKAITCTGAKTPQCLTASQIAALDQVIAGAKLPDGRLMYAPRIWDAGIGGRTGNGFNQGWRSWKLGTYAANANGSLDLLLSTTSLASIFTTPPTPIATTGGDQVAFGLTHDLAAAYRAMSARSAPYTQSALEFMKADATDLSKFRARGGKLIVVHGVSDPVFSIMDTVNWWNGVNKASGGTAAQFTRLFAVPGMNHCAGGPATDQFNAFAALVEWVEKGTPPRRIVATARATTPWPGRTRPLCPYPQQARYTGTGSIEEAANFVCK
jgi:hypothetical protein